MVAGGALTDPWAHLQAPDLASTALRAQVTTRPAKRRQMVDALLFRAKPRRKFEKSAHLVLHDRSRESTVTRTQEPEHLPIQLTQALQLRGKLSSAA